MITAVATLIDGTVCDAYLVQEYGARTSCSRNGLSWASRAGCRLHRDTAAKRTSNASVGILRNLLKALSFCASRSCEGRRNS